VNSPLQRHAVRLRGLHGRALRRGGDRQARSVDLRVTAASSPAPCGRRNPPRGQRWTTRCAPVSRDRTAIARRRRIARLRLCRRALPFEVREGGLCAVV